MIKMATAAKVLGTLLIASACSSTPSVLAVTEHTAKAQCAGVPAGITKMTAQKVQQLQQRQFLTETPTAPATADAGQLLVAVSHGDQPSPGYRFELRGATVSDGVAQLNLQWVTPPAGSMQATVMTSPCLVLALPPGAYRQVVAQDQNGVFGRLELNP